MNSVPIALPPTHVVVTGVSGGAATVRGSTAPPGQFGPIHS